MWNSRRRRQYLLRQLERALKGGVLHVSEVDFQVGARLLIPFRTDAANISVSSPATFAFILKVSSPVWLQHLNPIMAPHRSRDRPPA